MTSFSWLDHECLCVHLQKLIQTVLENYDVSYYELGHIIVERIFLFNAQYINSLELRHNEFQLITRKINQQGQIHTKLRESTS